jgi:GSH-dependent disulfide-bond oxidoreductase
MIDLYYWTTPNGHKVTMFLEETQTPYRIVPINIGRGEQFGREFLQVSPIMLEECGLRYNVIPVNIAQGEQFKPEFLKISPNNRIPAIVDRAPVDGGAPVPLFESCAILLYLAEKTGQLLSKDLRGRADALQWLFWQAAGLGPMAGQNHHFSQYASEKLPYAIDRYVKETSRLYAVLDKRLADREFIAGSYSIADIASYPWIVPYQRQGQDLANFPNLKRWLKAIESRPATVRAYAKVAEVNPNTHAVMDEQARKILFGQTAETIRSAG